MASIRNFVIAAFITAIFFNAFVIALGSFASANNIKTPAYLNSQYAAFSSNAYSNSVIAGISPLINKTGQIKNTTQSSGFIGGAITTVSVLTSMYNVLVTGWTGYVGFIGGALQLLGISTTFAQAIAILMILIIAVLSVLSAVMLFPI